MNQAKSIQLYVEQFKSRTYKMRKGIMNSSFCTHSHFKSIYCSDTVLPNLLSAFHINKLYLEVLCKTLQLICRNVRKISCNVVVIRNSRNIFLIIRNNLEKNQLETSTNKSTVEVNGNFSEKKEKFISCKLRKC